PRAVLLDLAARAQARQPAARQGPATLAQPGTDLRLLRAPHVLPHLRARRVRRSPQAVPARGTHAADVARTREGDRRGYLARARDAPSRGWQPAHHCARGSETGSDGG